MEQWMQMICLMFTVMWNKLKVCMSNKTYSEKKFKRVLDENQKPIWCTMVYLVILVMSYNYKKMSDAT